MGVPRQIASALLGCGLLFLLFDPGNPAFACSSLPAGSRFWVRLTSPISSHYAKPGTPITGFLLESPTCDGVPILAMKTPVDGRVVSGHGVGLGLWHETARLELEFTRLVPMEGPPIEIHSRVLSINNAREGVKKGVIHGIRASDTPQGTISSRLRYLPSIHLYPDPFLLGYKMLFPIFPEPEICLEPGTDIEVELVSVAAIPDGLTSPDPVLTAGDEPELTHELSELPERTYTSKGKEADVVNLVFTGAREELEQVFAIAGWKKSQHVSGKSFGRELHAFLDKTSYETAPMTMQFYEGRPAELMFEKTLDSYEKRDHLRIWSLPHPERGESLWVSAAVRETGATLSIRHRGFMHHVSPNLGEEQHTVLRDLEAADCVASVGSIERPKRDYVFLNATGEIFRTNGELTVIHLKPCGTDAHGAGFSDAPHYRPGNRAYRYARKEILTVRSDLLRANAIYAVFDLSRITVSAMHRRSLHRADMDLFRQSSSTQ